MIYCFKYRLYAGRCAYRLHTYLRRFVHRRRKAQFQILQNKFIVLLQALHFDEKDALFAYRYLILNILRFTLNQVLYT